MLFFYYIILSYIILYYVCIYIYWHPNLAPFVINKNALHCLSQPVGKLGHLWNRSASEILRRSWKRWQPFFREVSTTCHGRLFSQSWLDRTPQLNWETTLVRDTHPHLELVARRKNDHDIESAMAADHSGNHSSALAMSASSTWIPLQWKKSFVTSESRGVHGCPWISWMPMAASGCKLEEQALTKNCINRTPHSGTNTFPLIRFLADSSLFAEVLLCQS